MITYTFKTLDGGVTKFKKDVAGVSAGFHTPRFRPIIDADNGGVLFDSGKYSYNIDVTADTVIINKTATGGSSTTYNPGGITADDLHDALNILFPPANSVTGLITGNYYNYNTYTKELETFLPVTKGYDDTTITTGNESTYIDGVIFTKVGSLYYKKVLPNMPKIRWWGAKGDWIDTSSTGTDNSTAFQTAIDFMKASGYAGVFVDFASKERYYVGNKVNITHGPFVLEGNAPPQIMTRPEGVNSQPGQPLPGYITCPNVIEAVFDFGNDGLIAALPASGAFLIQRLVFWKKEILVAGPDDQPNSFIKFSANTNWPFVRPLTIRDCSFSGAKSALYFLAAGYSGTPSPVVACDVNIRDCVFTGLKYAVYAPGPSYIFNMSFTNNTAKGGGLASAAISGAFEGCVTIKNNMLEGSWDVVDIYPPTSSWGGNSEVTFRDNYLEATKGNFIARVYGKAYTCLFIIGHNYSVETTQTTDCYVAKGLMRVIIEDGVVLPSAFVNFTNKQALLTYDTSYVSDINITGGCLMPRTSLKGANFYITPLTQANDNSASAWLIPREYIGNAIPSGAVTSSALGSVTMVTPFGRTTTGRNITGYDGTGANDMTVTLTFAAGDYLVMNALIKWNSPQDNQTLVAYLFNQTPAGVGRAGQIAYKKVYGDGWHLWTVVVKATAAGTSAKLRIGTNGASAGPTTGTVDVAGVGFHVVAAGDIQTFSSQTRILIRPYVPYY